MSLPRKLKHFMLFNNGNRYQGDVPEVTLPKLTRKMEDYQAGGMSGPIKIDFGQEGITLEWTAGGLMIDVLKQWGALKHDAVQLRFTGGYQAEDSDTVDAVEIVIRGRHTELDMGTAKKGDDTTFKVTSSCSYYKLTINGETIMEFDFINMIENIGGVDLLAKFRTALGI